ncbi:MAG: hypothetical protein EKK51_02700 [Mycolicibacterium sp.]|uniref:hypothetical protein n=1 Tax=Mycolicibacterium sp. TaxID=2320850 RepID=UPI000F9A3A04|nr:hypothetical protein [Mycolicibacterium sp.]RUP34368.1 MAG: hypothetical protein EKK51_02700 [Mycolicibacterium sp.]
MTYLADHSLLLALPAFAPAFVVAGVVAWVAMKDRRAHDSSTSDGDETDSETPGSTDEDGSA